MYVCYSTYPYGQPTVTPVATADIAPSYVSTGAPTIQPAITEPILVPVTATPQGIQAALQSLPIAVCRKVFTFYFYHHVQSQFSTYSRWAIFFSVKKYWYFSYFLMKTYCGYSLEGPGLSEVLFMCTHNMHFCGEIKELSGKFLLSGAMIPAKWHKNK